jgi:hypothetical protein
MDELKSFSIGFRVTVGPPPDDVVVSGVVFNDLNRNGRRDSNEWGIPSVELRMTGVQETMPPEILRRAITDGRGYYGFSDVPAGVHKIEVLNPPHWVSTTPNPMIITLVEAPSGVIPIENVDFGFYAADTIPPPVFGPVPVGPGSPNDTLYTGSFDGVHSYGPLDGYVLDVMVPPILSPVGSPILMRIDEAKVWINQTLVYRFWCEAGQDVCFPGLLVNIPAGIVVPGQNSIRIEVQGSDRAFLIFSILRRPDAALE